MRQDGDDHVGAESKVLEGLCEIALVYQSHERVEKDQVNGQEDLNGGDVRIQVDSGFISVENVKE